MASSSTNIEKELKDNTLSASESIENSTKEAKHCSELVEEKTERPPLTEEEKKEFKEKCLELKKQGNEHFKSGAYEDALEIYSQGVKVCPDELAEDKSILLSNRAACYQKLSEHTMAIDDCTVALTLRPKYVKARIRRAQCYEATDKLDEAFEDYKLVLEQDRTNGVAGEACMRLPDQIQARNEKMKEEMMGKLKDLGNMVLKPFGLSTDNFKVQQDPNSGGYSINFQK